MTSNERETPKTYLTNHKGSILHYIMSLVINNLGASAHTHHIQTLQTKAISRNQAHVNLWPAVPGLIIYESY